MKFGGTSVADEQAIGRVTAIVARQIEWQAAADRPPIVVVSALSKVTDGLLSVARLIEAGKRDEALKRIDELAERHAAIASSIVRGDRLTRVIGDLNAEFAAVHDTVCDLLAP